MAEELYYGKEDQERLDCDPDDTFDIIVSNTGDRGIKYPVKVYEFKRRTVMLDGNYPLDHVLEYLDGEYGDIDGDFTTPSKSMKKAADKFIQTIIDEYEVWGCERTGNYYEFGPDGSKKYIKGM